MTRKQPVQAKDTRTQSERFIETARELGCDEDDSAFKAKLKVIAQQKPKDEATEPKMKARP
jgi:hypothetical protein